MELVPSSDHISVSSCKHVSVQIWFNEESNQWFWCLTLLTAGLEARCSVTDISLWRTNINVVSDQRHVWMDGLDEFRTNDVQFVVSWNTGSTGASLDKHESVLNDQIWHVWSGLGFYDVSGLNLELLLKRFQWCFSPKCFYLFMSEARPSDVLRWTYCPFG